MDANEIKKLKQQKLKSVLKKHREPYRVLVENENVCLYRDESKCIRCGKCKDICASEAGVFGTFEVGSKNICIGCGKCVAKCPTGALMEKALYREVLNEIEDYDKVLVVSIAPAVRVAIAEEFGFNAGLNDQGRLITALRMVGFDYVFDVTFGADLTVMEESRELINRKLTNKPLPMFTSCCPAWINYLEIYRPDLIKHVSTAKSPISMQGAIIKTQFAKDKNFDPKKIVHVVVAPCITKKFEIQRENIGGASKFWNESGIKDIDYILTTKELAHIIKKLNIPYGNLPEGKFNEFYASGSGGGMIFGSSGGVCESTLREAYYEITGSEPSGKLLSLTTVRGQEKIKEDTIDLGEIKLSVAVASGLASAKEILKMIDSGEKHYDFVEVMSCEGGCVAGPGQPKSTLPLDELREKRANMLYHVDENTSLRCAHNNPDIIKVYSSFLGKPLSELSKTLLHTSLEDRSKQYTFKEKKI